MWQRAEPVPASTEEWWLGGEEGFTLGAVILWLLYSCTCIALKRGHLGPIEPKHAKRTMWCLPVTVLVHTVSYLSGNLGEFGFLTGLSGKVLDSSLLLYLGVRMIPIAAFGMMLVSELAVLLFARGQPRTTFSYMRYPVMTVHATSLFYYVTELLWTVPMNDAFGRPMYPLRYFTWTCTVSCMLLSIYYIVDCQLRHMRTGAASLNRLYRDLTTGLICANGLFAAGFLASRPWGDRRYINAIFFMISITSFYLMLGCVDRMLFSTQEYAKARMPALSWQFAVTRTTVFLLWHFFPIVWALAAADAISVEVEHMGYVASDMAAKYALLFVYITSINNHSTVDDTLIATGGRTTSEVRTKAN